MQLRRCATFSWTIRGEYPVSRFASSHSAICFSFRMSIMVSTILRSAIDCPKFFIELGFRDPSCRIVDREPKPSSRFWISRTDRVFGREEDRAVHGRHFAIGLIDLILVFCKVLRHWRSPLDVHHQLDHP